MQDRLINPNLFIVSGGPGAGKTTVLSELAKRGFQYVPEAARQIIQEQVQTGGTALPWNDRETYTGLMLQRSIDSYLEHTPASTVMFSDRGIPDTSVTRGSSGSAIHTPYKPTACWSKFIESAAMKLWSCLRSQPVREPISFSSSSA